MPSRAKQTLAKIRHLLSQSEPIQAEELHAWCMYPPPQIQSLPILEILFVVLFPKVTTTRWNCFLFLMMCCFIGMRTVWLGCPHHFQLRIRLAFNFSFCFFSPNKCTISVYYYARSFISSMICLWLYLFPLVASKHLTTGFTIFSAFKIGYCLLLSGTEP